MLLQALLTTALWQIASALMCSLPTLPLPLPPPMDVEHRLYHPTGAIEPFITGATIRPILRDAGFAQEDIPRALEIVSCESGGNLDGSFYKLTNYSAVGMFQIHAGTWAESKFCPYSAERLLSPRINARCAAQIFQYDRDRGNSDWWQWQCGRPPEKRTHGN